MMLAKDFVAEERLLYSVIAHNMMTEKKAFEQ